MKFFQFNDMLSNKLNVDFVNKIYKMIDRIKVPSKKSFDFIIKHCIADAERY